MSDWILRQENVIRQEMNDAEKRAAQEARVSLLVSRFWTDLSYGIQADVNKLNANETIKNRIGGNIKFTETNTFSFDVVKDIFPAIYLTVTRKSNSIEIRKLTRELLNPDSCVRENDYRTNSKEEVEHFSFYADAADNLYLKNDQEEVLQPRMVSEYLLESLLIEPTKVNQRWF